MRTLVIAIVGLCAAAALLQAADAIAVNFRSQEAAGSRSLVPLFDGKASFVEKPAKTRTVAVFAGVPAGRCAILVVHDANAAGKLGRPKQAIGLSNVPQIGGSRPSFEQAAFAYGGRSATLSITTAKP